ncbi:glutamate-cysteine ligase family protein [Microbispora sp. NBC_01189]|uniref:glutamate-cysteine ligase family protein n=1 Tax=Microbispora sp. NBC_01189 TaxID=2903583 RepID=UPI002E143063|nr:glutamate-cysteine ligase family protein [Microbispora sp. NBC_01189]
MTDFAGDIAVGVEEEFHIVDLATRQLVPRAGLLLQQLGSDHFTQELQRSVLETGTTPRTRLEDLACSRASTW